MDNNENLIDVLEDAQGLGVTQDGNTTGGRPSNPRPKKKRFKKRYFAGIAAAVVLIAGVGINHFFPGTIASWWNKMGEGIGNLIHGNDLPQDSVTEIADTLPLDEDGILSITFPVVDRNLDDPAGLYSLPTGYSPYYVDYESSEQSGLSKVTDSSKNGVNVDNYQSSNGGAPSGYVGVREEYAAFLAQVEAIKANMKSGNSTYTSALTKIEYDVPDLYFLASGYDLYCEDVEAMNSARLAYVLADGSRIYSIPSNMVDKFMGVSKETCDLIVKYDGLRSQIADIYGVYTAEGVDIIEEEANFGR